MWGCGYCLFGPEYGPISGYFEKGHKYSGPLNSWNYQHQRNDPQIHKKKKKFLI